jgi:diguanylate cyclase (GGDEF)-like protein
MTPIFFAATMMTGGATGLINFVLAKRIVAPRLRTLAQAALKVETTLRDMSNSPEMPLWSPDEDLVPINSDDEIGETARAFNRLATTLCKSLRMEHTVRSFVGVISTNLELQPLARQALQLWISQSNACGGVILTDSDGKLVLAAGQGVNNPEEVASSDHVTRAFETRTSELIVLPENVRLDGVLAEFRPAQLLVIPVQYEGVSLGVVVLATAGSFEQEERARAEVHALGFGLALNNALAHERLQRLAALDPLTGVYNRRFGLGRLHEEFERSVRTQSHLGVLMMDIDLFKAVNDTYGHLVGDRVLKAIAGAARGVLREGDILVRYGGEEFLAVLPAASSDDVAFIGERIRRAVEDMVVPEGQHMVRVTLSVGGAALSDPNVNKETDLIELADQALYQVKQSGRNRVQVVG